MVTATRRGVSGTKDAALARQRADRRFADPAGWPSEALAEAEHSLISRGEVVLDRDPLGGAEVDVGREPVGAPTRPPTIQRSTARPCIAARSRSPAPSLRP